MTTLFALVFLIAVVGLTVGVIRPSLFKLATRKHAASIFGGAALLSFILVGVTLPESPQEETARTRATARPASREPENTRTTNSDPHRVTRDALTAAAQEALKNAKVSTMKVSYRGVRDENEDDQPGFRLVTVSYDVGDFLDRDALVRHTGEISSSVFRSVFAVDPKIRDVAIWYYGDTVDRYGKEKRDVILSYVIDRRTFAKINWSGFDEQKLCDFLNEENQLPGHALDTMCVPLVRIE